MTLLLLLWALGGRPFLGPPATSRQPDGTWKCSAACHTEGNADGGQCRTLIPGRGPTEEACVKELARKCDETKPPPGGCRWGNRPPNDSR